jgi:hypothetical protein
MRGAFRVGITILVFALKCVVPAHAQGKDSATVRLDRIQALLYKAHIELDSLKREMMAKAVAPVPKASKDTGVNPILSELLTERQKTLMRETITPYRQTAVGYAFNPNLGMGMTCIEWFNDWGAKIDAGIIITEGDRKAGVNASLLRSLNRFSLKDAGLETHLYAFTGLGITWERMMNGWNTYDPVANIWRQDWYETPDIAGRWQLGAGTEVSLLGFGGIKFVPEVGMQVSKYLKRFQDSPTWLAQNPAPGSLPKSDFSLDPYYAFHLNFYFR